MIMVRKTLVAIFAVILLSAGASLMQAQGQGYRGTFRSVRQLIVRIDNRAGVFSNNLQNALAAVAEFRGPAEREPPARLASLLDLEPVPD